MSVQSTSLDAYAETAHKRGTWEKAVLGCIRKYGPISDRAVAERLGKECGFVSARRNSLVKKGIVAEFGTVADSKTGQKVVLWGAMYQ